MVREALSVFRCPDRCVRRLAQLYAGLLLYGVSDSLLVLSGLGVDPWDVLHQGLSRLTGVPIGTVVIVVGGLVLLLWIPLRQRPGVGTLSNVVLIGLVMDAVLAFAPAPTTQLQRWGEMGGGVLLNGLATGSYIGAGLGPGPRDGLMTAMAARGRSIRVVRTSIEGAVVLGGWLLGGTVGVGTLAYAALIGPLAHVFIPMLQVAPAEPHPAPAEGSLAPAEPHPAPAEGSPAPAEPHPAPAEESPAPAGRKVPFGRRKGSRRRSRIPARQDGREREPSREAPGGVQFGWIKLLPFAPPRYHP